MKKAIVIILSIAMILAIALPAAALSTVAVKSIKLDSSKITLDVGQTATLKVTFTPANTTQKQLTYVTDNVNVAKIDAAGKISGVAAGTATITVYTVDKKIFAKCAVTVAKTGPFEFDFMNVYYDPEPPKANNDIMAAIEAYTNTKLDMIWVPDSSYDDKLSAVIAAGTIPKVIMVRYNKQGNIINAARGGMFWEVGPLLKDFPNLSKAFKIVMNNISIDGKTYGLYRTRKIARDGVIYRKDWLDALHLSEPRTINDLYNVIKAFTLNDPDKNGKNDTVGLVEQKQMYGFPRMAAWYGTPNIWGVQGGKLVPDFTTKEYMSTLAFYKRLYGEKLINQDFAVCEDKNPLLIQGKGGMEFETIDDVTVSFNDLTKINPNAVMDVIGKISGPEGVKVYATKGYNGMFMFPKSSVKTKDELMKILGFFDKLTDQKMIDLMQWGIEGKYFTMADGVPTKNADQQKLVASDLNPIRQLQAVNVFTPMQGKNLPIADKVRILQEGLASIAVGNPAEPFISNTQVEKGSELQKIIDDARIKYIICDLDEAGFLKEVDKWRTNGGNKIIDEMNAEYAKTKK